MKSSSSRAVLYRLMVATVCLRVVFFFGNVQAAAAEATVLLPQVVQSAVVNVIAPTDFLAYTNAARSEQGVAPLQLNDELDAAALAKAEDMQAKGYWAHFRPTDGKTPWSFIDAAGYHYKVAGENLAKGFQTANGITKAWLASPEHRANLLSSKYTEVGYASLYGVVDGQNVLLTVQMFGSR